MLTTFTRLRFAIQALLMGAVASLAVPSVSHAADSVLLRYQDRERVVTIEDLETFAETGEAFSEDMRLFLEENPDVGAIASDVLSTEIFVSPNLVERFNSSSIGEFVLIQLNKVLGTPSGSEDLEPLRIAVNNSFSDDNRFSVLEIAQNYPSDTIRLDFSDLQPIVNNVQAFVERVEPALQVAREFLQDTVCDCETAPTDDVDDTANGAEVEDDSSTVSPAGSDTEESDTEEDAPTDAEDATSTDAEESTPADAEESAPADAEEAGSSQSLGINPDPCKPY